MIEVRHPLAVSKLEELAEGTFQNAIGEIDEQNSSLGVLLCEYLPDTVRSALLDVQNDLFDLGGELCLPGMEVVKEIQVTRLEARAQALQRGGVPLDVADRADHTCRREGGGEGRGHGVNSAMALRP